MAEYVPNPNTQSNDMPQRSDMMPGTVPPNSNPYGTRRPVQNSRVDPRDAKKLRDRVLALFPFPNVPPMARGKNKRRGKFFRSISLPNQEVISEEVPQAHWIPECYYDSSIMELNVRTAGMRPWTTGVNVWTKELNSWMKDSNTWLRGEKWMPPASWSRLIFGQTDSDDEYQRPNGQYQMSSFKYQIPSVDYQMPNVEYQIPSVEYQMPNVEYQMPNVEYQIPNGEYQRSNGECQRSNGECQRSNGEYQRSNGEYQRSNGEYQVSNGGCQMSNGQYQRPIGPYQRSNGQYQSSNGQYQSSNGEYQRLNAEYQSSIVEYLRSNAAYQRSNGENQQSNGENHQSNGENQQLNGEYPQRNGEYQQLNEENLHQSFADAWTNLGIAYINNDNFFIDCEICRIENSNLLRMYQNIANVEHLWLNDQNPRSKGEYPWPIGMNTVIDLSYWYYRAKDPLSIYSFEYMERNSGNKT